MIKKVWEKIKKFLWLPVSIIGGLIAIFVMVKNVGRDNRSLQKALNNLENEKDSLKEKEKNSNIEVKKSEETVNNLDSGFNSLSKKLQ